MLFLISEVPAPSGDPLSVFFLNLTECYGFRKSISPQNRQLIVYYC